jgi:hypothetical protein
MKPPKVPVSPQLEGYTMIGPNYPAGEYTVKLHKGPQVYESSVRLVFDPASRHSVADQQTRQDAVMKAYHLLEKLAYLDHQAVVIRDAAKDRSKDLSKSLSRKLHGIETRMDSIHLKMVVVKEGKVVEDERLREKIGFLYGAMLSYKGKPTDSQLGGLESLSAEVNRIDAGLTDFQKNELQGLNIELVKAGKKEITLISGEEFKKQP